MGNQTKSCIAKTVLVLGTFEGESQQTRLLPESEKIICIAMVAA